MSINSVIIVFICLGYVQIHCQQVLRTYVIKKDFFTGLKSGEFSIYDPSENNLLYRIESRYGFTHTAEVFSYPGKRLVASIKNNWYLWIYDADIRIYDMFFNQWIPGKITQAYPPYSYRFTIQYANRRLVMQHLPFTFTSEIRDDLAPYYVLARIRKRPSSIILPNKYDLQVYTNELSDIIYFLAVAAYDHNNSIKGRTSQQTHQKNK